LFLGCSTEGLPAARALQRNLETVTEVAIWNQDLSAPNRSILDNVLAAVRTADFAALVLPTTRLPAAVVGARRRETTSCSNSG
jgi:predicted nucleotide-binding protein